MPKLSAQGQIYATLLLVIAGFWNKKWINNLCGEVTYKEAARDTKAKMGT